MKVIAFTGRAGSGKDTAARGIQLITGSIQPYNCVKDVVDLDKFFNIDCPNSLSIAEDWPILKFAYPVYQIAAILTGHACAEDIMYSNFKNTLWDLGSKSFTGRQILQLVGTEGGREIFGEGLWLSIMSYQLKSCKEKGHKGALITDCRFLNEDAFCAGLGATRIKMQGRNDETPQYHPSETELELIQPDYIVDNKFGYNYMMDQLQEICNDLKISNHQYTWK